MLILKVVLKKEVANETEGQVLFDQIKALVAPKEPIEKDGRVLENTVLE